MKTLITLLIGMLITGCSATSSYYPKPIVSINTNIENNVITKKITPKDRAYDLYIKGYCGDANGIRFSMFSSFGKKGSGTQWAITNKSENTIGRIKRHSSPNNSGIDKWSKDGFLNYINDSVFIIVDQSKRYKQDNIGEYSQEEFQVNELINSCLEINEGIRKKRILTARKKEMEIKSFVDKTSKRLGVKPMYSGENVESFLDIGYQLLEYGESKFKNKFVWIKDGIYEVKNIKTSNLAKDRGLNYLVMLPSHHLTYQLGNIIPVIVISKKKAIVGQVWQQVSEEPLTFTGIVSGQKLRSTGVMVYDEQYMVFLEQ